ncbi:MAG: hypothetical protein K6U08_00390 [Firmicutes bacterium]|nr:hypothetical protein [Bacillota bacterium]
MAHAYTPGLKVTDYTVLRRQRRLPIPGDVLVKLGDTVRPDTVVAKTMLPGDPQTLNAANVLALLPNEVRSAMKKKEGDTVKAGEVIGISASFFGLLKKRLVAPCDGTIERISDVSGQVTLRQPPTPLELTAYINGKVAEILPREGVVIETRGAYIQGIFGVGGEKYGPIRFRAQGPDRPLTAADIDQSCKGCVVVGGSLITGEAIRKAVEVGAHAVVAGGIIDIDLVAYLGYDIGVAITGHEDVSTTLIVTEGFGPMRMADKTYGLLKSLDGLEASVTGATQIRAGVMRPEIIVSGYQPAKVQTSADTSEGLVPGTPVRLIREPYFGRLATVVELPPDLVVIETEAKVRILKARLESGEVVTVPRANVEILES